MDTKFQTSFIPKKPIIPSGKAEHNVHPTNFFSLLTSVLLVITLLAAAGVFAYQGYLSNRIKTLDTQLAQMEETFESELITELSHIDSRLKSAKSILENHLSTVSLFELLEAITLQDVQFTNFDYTLGSNGITVEMSGKARNYSTLVLQSDEFVNSKDVRSIVFSNLDLDSTGNVLFRLALQINKTGFLYKNSIQTLSFEGFPF
ncbi:MAG: hypothetical protein KAR00_00550 [Candidatus Pacebacteria bacterium]|nr:hypothetical protein [Candidatus Paceibacterota bacterium]